MRINLSYQYFVSVSIAVLRLQQSRWNPSCRWSKYFVIVGLPTNNLVVAEGQDISDLEAEFDEH
jgi:hypothetical protein